MKKLVLMMALILGINAMAHDCCDVKNNEKCDCPIEKKIENTKEETQNTENNTKVETKKVIKKVKTTKEKTKNKKVKTKDEEQAEVVTNKVETKN